MALTLMSVPAFTWTTMFILLLVSSCQVSAHGGVGHGSNGHNEKLYRSESLIVVKIWCLVILPLSSFAGVVSPYFYRRNESCLLLGT